MSERGLDSRLALVDGILRDAFFSPLGLHDWPAFCFGQPALLGLEEEEAFDLFLRAAIVAETMDPAAAEGRLPLAWLWGAEGKRQVLAHALASLKDDRPFLFHRVLWSLPAVAEDRVDPDQYELMEDFLAAALEDELDLSDDAEGEIVTTRRRALKAAGQDFKKPDPACAQWARQVLQEAPEEALASDGQLRLWLTLGGGLDQVPEALRPGVLVEAWSAWTGAVTGGIPDLDLLAQLSPRLGLDAPGLALHAPPSPQGGQVIEAACPFCQTNNRLRLGKKIEELKRCPHLIYVGSADELHLWQAVQNFEIGRDFVELMASYLQSRSDLELFSTLVNDLYEMLAHQGRLQAAPIRCESAAQGFHFLRAYFAGQPDDEATRH